MAAIVSVTDGVDDILATHINQYAQMMNNIFNITDTAQANLGRLPLPWLSADPAPANGLMWMRSDLGSNGRLRIRHSGATVDYVPIRQRFFADQTSPLYLGTLVTQYDVPGCTITFTPTGGDIEIGILGNFGQFFGLLNAAVGPNIYEYFYIYAGALLVGQSYWSLGSSVTQQLLLTRTPPGWIFRIPAASYAAYSITIGVPVTIKMQVAINGVGTLGSASVQQFQLAIREVGP